MTTPVMIRLGTTVELGGVPVGLSQVQGLQATLVATQPGASVQLKVKAGEVVPLSGRFYRVVTVHDGGATHVPGGSKSYVQLEASAEPQRAERLAVPVGASMNAMGFDFAVTSVQGDTVSVEAWPDQHARKNTRPELIKSYTGTSTFFIIEAMMTERTPAGAVRAWSESTPMASLPAALAAVKTPPPEPPAAW